MAFLVVMDLKNKKHEKLPVGVGRAQARLGSLLNRALARAELGSKEARRFLARARLGSKISGLGLARAQDF